MSRPKKPTPEKDPAPLVPDEKPKAKPAAKKVKKTKKVATPVEAKVAPDAAAKK